MHTATRARLAGQLVENLLQKAKGPTLSILEPFCFNVEGLRRGISAVNDTEGGHLGYDLTKVPT